MLRDRQHTTPHEEGVENHSGSRIFPVLSFLCVSLLILHTDEDKIFLPSARSLSLLTLCWNT